MKYLTFVLLAFALSASGQQKSKKQFEGHPHPNGVVITVGDTSKYHISSMQDEPHLYEVLVVDFRNTLLTISAPDKNGVATIIFTKSKVHFINDSTFTIKPSK